MAVYEIKFYVRQLESHGKEIKITLDGVENKMHTAYLYLSVTDEIPMLGQEFMGTFQRLVPALNVRKGVEQ